MERRDWLVYPWQVAVKVAEWQARFPDLVTVDVVQQYTRHKVYAITITATTTDRATAEHTADLEKKRKHLFYVPHAHEPAGTAGCMNFINQLLVGKHLDGTPSTLNRAAILQESLLTFIPDANPQGRARCPEPYWEGTRYNNREFINMVFGIGDLSSADAHKPRWERFKRVGAFTTKDESPARLGLVYEQVGEHDYVEPGRYDDRASLVKLLEQLGKRFTYDQVLTLHQTEFEGMPDTNCEAILPDLQPELPAARQEYNRQWAQALAEAWTSVGGLPRQNLRSGFGLLGGRDGGLQLHRRIIGDVLSALQRASAFLTLEIQNNSPQTPAEQQLLLFDTAIWRSVEYLLTWDRG